LNRFRGCPRIGRNIKFIKQGFDLLLGSRTEDQLDFDVTSIATDNTAARRLLECNLPGMPIYQPLTDYTTFILSTRRCKAVAPNTEAIDIRVIEEIESLQQQYGKATQLAPRYSMGRLSSMIPGENWILVRRNSRIVAAAGLWDQRPAHQISVTGYGPVLSIVRPWHNIVARVLNQPILPTKGSQLRIGFLAFAAFDSPQPSEVLLLIRRALLYAKTRGLDYLAFGSTGDTPLGRTTLKHFHPWKFGTTIYTVTRNKSQSARGSRRNSSLGLEAALL
jgi:hypothetical protein